MSPKSNEIDWGIVLWPFIKKVRFLLINLYSTNISTTIYAKGLRRHNSETKKQKVLNTPNGKKWQKNIFLLLF